jgi:hypothetical protein
MPSKEKIEETVERLRAQAVLSESEVQSLFQKAVDIDYWKTLSPRMGVLDLHSVDHLEGEPYSSEQQGWALAHLARHGYFQMRPLARPDLTARMCASVEVLRGAGWPAVFTFVYDEFWTVWRTPSMIRLLSGYFEAGYLQTCGVWTYRVEPQQRSSGWAPHVDSRNDEERLSVWIPLTDATIDNGCMYVIPLDRVPPGLPTSYLDWKSISTLELGTLLHSVTPLPANVGSVLGWNNRLIHWGGRATELAACPRISIAAEFLHERTRPHRGELPVFGVTSPDFPTRLRVIGQAILKYEKFEPLMRRYRDLASNLIDWVGSTMPHESLRSD